MGLCCTCRWNSCTRMTEYTPLTCPLSLVLRNGPTVAKGIHIGLPQYLGINIALSTNFVSSCGTNLHQVNTI